MKQTIGVSFSLHRCQELGVDKKKLFEAACNELGFRRFRLMSYWNIHEPSLGAYDFSELDWQLDIAAKCSAEVSLCLGKRQPRWPECHIPDWALALPKQEWYQALFDYITVVVKRYKDHPAITSWQLENEALLKSFGNCRDKDFSRSRLWQEFSLIKRLDAVKPVVMTLSDSWGTPLRRPHADQYAMSLYRATMRGNNAHQDCRPEWAYSYRAKIIRTFQRKPVFIHELQAEPWLSQSIVEIPTQEQLKHMSLETIMQNIAFAERTGLSPIDLWGLEWWYWLKETHNVAKIWNGIRTTINSQPLV